jgi:hypothetical protein
MGSSFAGWRAAAAAVRGPTLAVRTLGDIGHPTDGGLPQAPKTWRANIAARTASIPVLHSAPHGEDREE